MAEYRKGTGPDQLPQGAAKQLNEAQPKGESAGGFDPTAAVAQGIQGIPPDLSSELAPKLFGPTDRPDEPVTNGMPFGPGANYAPPPNETPQERNQRIAQQLRQAGQGDAIVDQMADRLAQGI